MSTRVAGQRATSGYRERAERGGRSRTEDESFRRGLHDFERRHGRRVRAAKPHHQGEMTTNGLKQRIKPGAWHVSFIAGLARTGEIKSAAQIAGVRPDTAERRMRRDTGLQGRCWQALGQFALRMLQQLSKGQIERWELSPRTAKALMGAMTQMEA